MVDLHIDWEQVVKDMAKNYATLNKTQINRATYRALNHTILRTRTRTSTYIRKNSEGMLNASKKAVDSRMIVKKANRSSLKAHIRATSRPLRAANFPFSVRKGRRGPRGSNGARPGSGISVKIHKGRRKLIARAFVQKITRKRRGGQTSEHIGIFARGKYGPNGFEFKHGPGTGKGKITQIRTTTIPQKMDDKENLTILRREMGEHFPKRLQHLLVREAGLK